MRDAGAGSSFLQFCAVDGEGVPSRRGASLLSRLAGGSPPFPKGKGSGGKGGCCLVGGWAPAVGKGEGRCTWRGLRGRCESGRAGRGRSGGGSHAGFCTRRITTRAQISTAVSATAGSANTMSDASATSYRLEIELVPQTAWYCNLRKVVTQKQWDVLRRQCYRAWGCRCGVCGAGGRLSCHEQGHCNDEIYLQTLKGFIALCDLCHHCKHIGYAGILARQGQLDFAQVVAHFCRVNACTEDEFEHTSDQAFAQFYRRSRHPWETDLGRFSPFVTTPQR